MVQKFTDRARATLQGSINTVATSLAVSVSLADRFPVANTADWLAPGDWFRAILVDVATGAFEVVKVGTRASGSATLGNLLRAQDGTTAQSFTAGALVIHGPTASDFQHALAGIFAYIATTSDTDPKHEVIKTGTGAAAAMWHMVSGKMTLAQSDGAGNVVADRFTFDQTTGDFSAAGFNLTSDERLKSGWRNLPRNFIARLADVKRGIYRKEGRKHLEVGVSAQSLKPVMPWAVHKGPGGLLAVEYANAALVAAIELAADNVQLRTALVDLEERIKRLERRA
jgi:hypothetical protein